MVKSLILNQLLNILEQKLLAVLTVSLKGIKIYATRKISHLLKYAEAIKMYVY